MYIYIHICLSLSLSLSLSSVTPPTRSGPEPSGPAGARDIIILLYYYIERELTGITASTLRDRRGVEGRARTVANQYVARCRLVDGRIVPGIQPGPLDESRLLQLGGSVQAIVVGNYNEGSSALH